MYHVIDQPIYQQCTPYHAIDQPIYQLCTMQSTNLSTICVQNHAINQPIYELYAMQLISMIEADSRVILLLVNLYVQLLSDYLQTAEQMCQ